MPGGALGRRPLEERERAFVALEALRLIAEEGTRANILIHPYFCESRWYDFENFNRYIEAGRTAAEAALPQILDLIQRPTPVPEHSSALNAADTPATPSPSSTVSATPERRAGLPGYA